MHRRNTLQRLVGIAAATAALFGPLAVPATVTAAPSGVPVASAVASFDPAADDLALGQFGSCAVRFDTRVVCWGMRPLGSEFDGTYSVEPIVVPGLVGATGVAVGQDHACAVLDTGLVQCWGENSSHELGDDTDVSSVEPTLRYPLYGPVMEDRFPLRATQVAVSAGFSCAVTSARHVACWGSNIEGQTAQTYWPISPYVNDVGGVVNAVYVGTGADHACALIATGNVKCWGSNAYGQSGYPIGTTWESPGYPTEGQTVAGISNATALAVGGNHTCALLSDHTVKCWGANYAGQTGDGSTSNHSDPRQVVGLSNVVSLAAGRNFTCAAIDDGTVECWGDIDTVDGTSITAATVPWVGHTSRLHSGGHGICAVVETTRVQCWGDNAHAQLGAGGPLIYTTPAAISGVAGAVDLGGNCATFADGTASCWGGGNIQIWAPDGRATLVDGLSGAVAAEVLGDFGCALIDDGTVECWGTAGWWGALGENIAYSDVPVPVPVIADATALDVDYQHSCALTATGEVLCWGRWYGHPPQPFSALTGFTALAVGSAEDCAVRDDGTVWCAAHWPYTYAAEATQVAEVSNAVAVAVADDISCAVIDDGTVSCWGNAAAATIPGLTDVIDVRADMATMCALTATGEVWCWGDNVYGTLGNGTTQPSTVPVPVTGIDDALQIEVHEDTACALLTDHTVTCWGESWDGAWSIGYTLVAPLEAPRIAALWTPTDVGAICPEGTPAAGTARRAGDTNCDGLVRIAILGDALTSGEGSTDYTSERADSRDLTDNAAPPDGHRNMCHRSVQSWAVGAVTPLFGLAGTTGIGALRDEVRNLDSPTEDDLVPGGKRSGQDALLFVACSGAGADDLAAADADNWDQPAQLASLAAFQTGGAADIVLVSVGLVDTGEGDVLLDCITTGCIEPGKPDAWLAAVKASEPTIRSGLVSVREAASGAEVYFLEQPNPFDASVSTKCSGLSIASTIAGHFGGGIFQSAGGRLTHTSATGTADVSRREYAWLRDYYIPAVNRTRNRAADLAGLHVVGAAGAVAGNGLCSTNPQVRGTTPNSGEGNVAVSPAALLPLPAAATTISAAFRQRFAGRLGRNPLSDPSNSTTTGPDRWTLTTPGLGYLQPVQPGQTITVQVHGPTPIEAAHLVLGTLPIGLTPVVMTGVDAAYSVTVPQTAPGVASLELMDDQNHKILASIHLNVAAPSTCAPAVGTADFDGDRLPDWCDPALWDGPNADFDADGQRNRADICPALFSYFAIDPEYGDGWGSCSNVVETLTPSLVQTQPMRLLDTRPNGGTFDFAYNIKGARKPNVDTPVQVYFRGGVGADATAVALTVTVSAPAVSSSLKIYACGTPLPSMPSLTFLAGKTTSAMLIVPIGKNGTVCVRTSAKVHVTRPRQQTVDGMFASYGVRAANSVTVVNVTGRGNVPAGANAVVLTFTVSTPTKAGTLTAAGCGASSAAGTMSYPARRTWTAMMVVTPDAMGRICFTTSSKTHVTIESLGYFTARPNVVTIPTKVLNTINNRAGVLTLPFVANAAGIPADATSVVVKTTGSGARDMSSAIIGACGVEWQQADAWMEFARRLTVFRTYTIPQRPPGQTCLYVNSTAKVTVELLGAFVAG